MEPASNFVAKATEYLNLLTTPPEDLTFDADTITLTAFPKSGTKWAQQILHQLRTGGDEKLGEISAAVPNPVFHIEKTVRFQEPLQGDEHKERLKVYKTRFMFSEPLFVEGKHIYLIRNPYDVMWAFFRGITSLVNTQGTTIEEFFYDFYSKVSCNYWDHIASWWPHHFDRSKVLVVHYEDLHENLPLCLRKLNAHFSLGHSEEVLRKLEPYCSTFKPGAVDKELDHVRERLGLERDLDSIIQPLRQLLLAKDAEIREVSGEGMLFRPMQDAISRMESGAMVGQGSRNIPLIIRNEMQKLWEKKILPVTGCHNYTALRDATSLLND